MQKSPPDPQNPTEAAAGKVSGADLKRLNEVRTATGRGLDYPTRGKPDANINTPKVRDDGKAAGKIGER